MKSSKKITLVIISSLLMIGCAKDPEDDKDDTTTAVIDPTNPAAQVIVDNSRVGMAYQGGGFYPWFYNPVYYSAGRYCGPEPSFYGISSGSSTRGSGSFSSRSSFSSARGGFGGSFGGGGE